MIELDILYWIFCSALSCSRCGLEFPNPMNRSYSRFYYMHINNTNSFFLCVCAKTPDKLLALK